jgi:lysophospholipase L1-like esterase
VKEIIQADIHSILSKIDNLADRSNSQLETHISWTKVASIKQTKRNHNDQKTTDHRYSTLTSNRYKLLENDDPGSNTPSPATKVGAEKPTVTGRKKAMTNNHKKKPSIVIIGDSHARGLAAEISYNLGHVFEVTGTVAPGARLEHIMNMADDIINPLGKRDTVIMIGGTNDINKNEANLGLRHLRKFIENRRNINILAMTAPHRYDLQESSCVNSEIVNFNRKLGKVAISADNVKIIQPALDRNDFTRHGMHLNISGKEKLARMLEESIVQLMAKKTVTPYILKWKEKQSDPHQAETEDNPTHDVNDVTTPEQVNVSEQGPTSTPMDYSQNSPSVEGNERMQLVVLDSTKDADPVMPANTGTVDPSTVPPTTPTKEDTLESSSEKADIELKSAVRTSNRAKKIPSTRNEDFLWSMHTSKTI